MKNTILLATLAVALIPIPGCPISVSSSNKSIHVPVVTPCDKADQYGPPQLEQAPLPPV